jgi:hypothetical protein
MPYLLRRVALKDDDKHFNLCFNSLDPRHTPTVLHYSAAATDSIHSTVTHLESHTTTIKVRHEGILLTSLHSFHLHRFSKTGAISFRVIIQWKFKGKCAIYDVFIYSYACY